MLRDKYQNTGLIMTVIKYIMKYNEIANKYSHYIFHYFN